jgi:hypothetical protein
VSYFPVADIGVSLGYITEGGLLGEDNKPRNLFENPAALFTISIIIAPDALFERLTSPARDQPAIYFGRNAPQTAPALSSPNGSRLHARQPSFIEEGAPLRMTQTRPL